MPRTAPRPKATPPRGARARTATTAAATTRAFLFSDLRGYTSFVEGHGDAAAAKLLREYRTLVRKEVARHRGAEVKTEGDSFYVVFESASSALDCAVGIVRRVQVHAAKDAAYRLRVAIGLHAGDTVAYDQQFVGSAVNIAARLVAKAGEGEILVSDTIRGMVRTGRAYPMSDRGQLKLKGVTERVRAWSVDWREATVATTVAPAPEPVLPPTVAARVRAPSGQVLCPAVVGRDAELTEITKRLDRALAAEASTIVLGGDAGVGKSALVRRAQEVAAARGFRLLTGLTVESSSGLPYGPFVSAVRSGFRGLDHDRLGRVLVQVAPALGQLFPELGRQATGADPPSGLERNRLSVAFQLLFHAFAREAPMLLVLEDLHWADEATLELLRELARELRDARVVILATYRSDELHRRHPFVRALANLQRERLVTTIALRRLSREELGELIRLTFGPTQPVTDEFRDAIYSRTEGNPFFTEELLKALVESGEIFFDDQLGRWTRGTKTVEELKIPDSIVDAVRGRLERLSPDAQTTLAAAAVIGQRFPFDLLGAVRGAPVNEVETHLREFIDLQLVAEHGRDEDVYAFRHALSREVVYDDLLVSERKRLHRAVAEQLIALPAAEPSLVAHHLVAAGEPSRAVPYLLEAAARAFRADAPREAVKHYEHALEIGVADDAQPITLERLAEAYRRFDPVRCAKAAEDAVARYRERGDALGASRAMRVASGAFGVLGEGARARALAAEAIDVLAGLEDSKEYGQAVARLAGLKMVDGALAEALALADRALAVGERLDDAFTLAWGLVVKGSAIGYTDPKAGLAILVRGRELAIARGIPEAAVTAYNNEVVTVWTERTPEQRVAMIDEGISYAHAHGVEVTAFLVFFRALHQYGRGDWDDAARTVDDYSRSVGVEREGFKAWIALGRQGPGAALPLYLAEAERAIRRQEGQNVVWSFALAAWGCALAGDEPAASGWLDRLRARISEDAAVRVFLGRGPGTPQLLLTGLLLGQDGWPEMVESVVGQRTDDDAEERRGWARVVRALSRDEAPAATDVEDLYDRAARQGGEAFAMAVFIVAANEARRRGVALGPEWTRVRARARAFAERAKASWWLGELDHLGT